jgi:hypothetical protein
MGTQPRCQRWLIDFTLADFFKGDHLFDSRGTNIVTIQYEEQTCDHIGGSLFTSDKAMVLGETAAVCSRQIKYVRIIMAISIYRFRCPRVTTVPFEDNRYQRRADDDQTPAGIKNSGQSQAVHNHPG